MKQYGQYPEDDSYELQNGYGDPYDQRGMGGSLAKKRVHPPRESNYSPGNQNRQRNTDKFNYSKPINNEFKPLVKISPQVQRSSANKSNDKNQYRGSGSADDKNHSARIAGKYESDREDDRFESGRRLD